MVASVVLGTTVAAEVGFEVVSDVLVPPVDFDPLALADEVADVSVTDVITPFASFFTVNG